MIDQKKNTFNNLQNQVEKIKISSNPNLKDIELILAQVCDPEIPVLSIFDLGILREVEIIDGEFLITITPTYVGCPAMGMIEMNIKAALEENNIFNYRIKTILSPAWSTSWITKEGKLKLKNYGIAPPLENKRIQKLFEGQGQIECPRCNSMKTEMISEFGSTACKSLYRCKNCLEAFDYFKCH